MLDFVCLEARSVIEVDGGQHGERIEDDRLGTEWLVARGFQVVRFWNNELLNNLEEVKTDTLNPHPNPPFQGEGVVK